MRFTVIAKPAAYLGQPIRIAHFVVSNVEIAKRIEEYFNKEDKGTEYGAIQVFKRLARGKKPYTYADAVKHCNYLNRELRYYENS